MFRRKFTHEIFPSAAAASITNLVGKPLLLQHFIRERNCKGHQKYRQAREHPRKIYQRGIVEGESLWACNNLGARLPGAVETKLKDQVRLEKEVERLRTSVDSSRVKAGI